MKTEQLVQMLAVEAPGVNRDLINRQQGQSLTLGVGLATVLMLAILGLRPDLAQAVVLPMFWLKLAFPASLALAALAATWRLGHPGMAVNRSTIIALALPVLVIWALALTTLQQAPAAQRMALLWGASWRECTLNIAWLSAPIFVATLWAARRLAPTRLRLAGAACGAFAGAASATVYALHCNEMQAPFIAVWYLLGILSPAAVGAAVGPRLLRW
jgi:hypothetical protein